MRCGALINMKRQNLTEAENARLEGVIASALAAMDQGRYGDARRILRTGNDKPLLPETGVIAKGGAGL